MNDKTFDDKVKADLDTVREDGFTSMSRLEDKISQSTEKVKEIVTTWAEGGVAQLSRKVESLKGDTLEKVAVAAKTVEQDLDQGLNQYNVKVQELADRIPGNFSRKAARYPWVAISIALIVGFLLGSFLLKPVRKPLGLLPI